MTRASARASASAHAHAWSRHDAKTPRRQVRGGSGASAFARALAPVTLALALALALVVVVPPANAALPPWSLDETVLVVDEHSALRTWRVTYDAHVYSNEWTLALPTDVTPIGAHDATGPLPNSTSGGKMHVTSRSGTFDVDLIEKLSVDGAFVKVPGGPSAASDSPTSVRYRSPAGWTLAGWVASPGLGAPKDATWRATGPFFVEALLLPAGVTDPGPDPRGVAGGVTREADARVSATSAEVDVTIVYDTEQYAPKWVVPVPEGATLASVTAPLGTPTFDVKGGTATITTPYPFGHHLGARAFTLHFTSPTWRFGGGFVRANVSVPAGTDDATTLAVTLDGVDLVGARLNGVLADGSGHYVAKGPVALALVTVPQGRERGTVGPFTVEAPDAASREKAFQTATVAAAVLASAAPFVDAANARPMHVIYTNEPVFQWEEGVYSGNEAISIRASDLAGAGANLTPTRTLVHEATHALVDQMRKGAPLDSSFLNEGLSRLAETHVELAHPEMVVHCVTSATSQSCTRDSARIDAERLQAFYKRGGTFDVGWSASAASEDERAFSYDYSGFVLASYERHAPSGALGRALQALATNLDPEADDIINALLHEAPGMTRDQLLYPGKEHAGLAGDAFAAALGDLVAPPFPKASGGLLPTPGAAPALLVLALVGGALLMGRRGR